MNCIYNFCFHTFHALFFSSNIRTRGSVFSFPTNVLILIDKKIYQTMSEDRKMYKCTCSDCKKETEVPFEPAADRPVYCKECYQKNQQKNQQK